MIRYLTPARKADFLAACAFDPVLGTRIQTLLACYGHNFRLLDCWVAYRGDSPTAALARFEGHFTVSAGDSADLEECAGFMHAVGGFHTVQGTPALCRALAGGDVSCAGAPTMQYAGRLPGGDFTLVDASPSPAQIFSVLCAADTAFAEQNRWDAWYPHVSHLLRHNLGFAALLHAPDGTPAATAGVYSLNEGYGVLAAVATAPAYRGCGYASLLVRYLAARLLAHGKTPVLACASDALSAFYERLGFVPLGQWAQYTCSATQSHLKLK